MALSELETVCQQEEKYQFSSFDGSDALGIGLKIVEEIASKGKSVEVDIELDGHCLFHHAMKGTSLSNTSWIRRKKNMMKLDDKSTLRVFLELEQSGKTFEQTYGQKPDEFAAGGGGFPLRITGKGTCGTICVSGLPHKEDHEAIIMALQYHAERK